MADVFQTLRQRGKLQGTQDPLTAPFEPRVPNIGGEVLDKPDPYSTLFKQPPLKVPASTPTRQDGDVAEIQKYLDLYMPDTRATDMFMNLMENIPQRNKPGNWRRAGAGLAALGKGGMEVGDRILYEPYYREMADFKTKADLLKDLAGAERQGNVNERLMLSSLLRQDVAERQQATREAAQAEREKAGEAKREMDRIRVRLAQIREDKTLSDAQKAALNAKYAQDLERLRQEGRIGLAGEQAELDQELERLRQEGRIELEGVEQEGRKEIKTMEEDKDELATQTKVREYRAAREAFNTHPEWRKFLKLGAPGTNDFQITTRSAWTAKGQEENLAEYEKLYKFIYGEDAGGPNPTVPPRRNTPTVPPKKEETPPPAAPPARVGGPGGRGNAPAPKKEATTTTTTTITRKIKSKKTGKTVDATSTDGGKTWKLPDGRILSTQ